MPWQLGILIDFTLGLTCKCNTGNTDMLSNLDDICAISYPYHQKKRIASILSCFCGLYRPKVIGGWPFALDLLIKGKQNLLCWNLLTAVLVLKPATACAREACGPEPRLCYRYSHFHWKKSGKAVKLFICPLSRSSFLLN